MWQMYNHLSKGRINPRLIMTREERKKLKQQQEEEKMAKMTPEIREAYINQKKREKVVAAVSIPLSIVVAVVIIVLFVLFR